MKLREQLQASTRETRDSEEVCPPPSRALFGTLPLYVRQAPPPQPCIPAARRRQP